MPGQDQKPEETPATPATAVPVTTNAGDNKTQISQMRQNLASEIQRLKKQALLLQLQSMKVLQQSINAVYQTQAQKTSEQIALQNTDLQQQLEEETKAMQPAAASDTKHTDETNDGDKQVQAFNTIVLNAMQAARQSVDSAMQAAQKIMTDAEKSFENLPDAS